MKKILIVVDIQNDFVSGSLGTPQAQMIIPNVIAKINESGKRGDLILFTRDTHQSNYLDTQEGKNLPVVHCIEGTEGWEICRDIDMSDIDYLYVDKPSFGWAKWNETLRGHMDDVKEIELCGLCTDICVISNALILKAYFPEVKVTVDASCCAGVTEESHKAALLTMKMCQVNVINDCC